MSAKLWLCAFLAVYRTQTCRGFNLDQRFPVIKEGETKGSLFGFSVALHEQTVGSRQHLLLVGAPKEKANGLKDVNETGAVYACPISTTFDDCSRMDLVTQPSSSEMVEGMWLGVTVASQKGHSAGRVLMCGHRYAKIVTGGTEEQRRMIGKCYVRSNDLTLDATDFWQTDSYEVCNPGYDMESEGQCNLGISGGIGYTDVYLGAVGSYTWQGNVHVIWRNPEPDNSWEANGKAFGELDNRNIYMGYSVLEEQKLLKQDQYTVVTGAPRFDSRGSVILGEMSQAKISLMQLIPGEQVGSYFGSSLAAADLNNDDWNDLIVGAPFYFERQNQIGGAVYIFMNENGSFQNVSTKVLKGPAYSGFGFAVAAIGDVNQDGFQDFAVGAPFQETGRVYIWMGSKKGISDKYSQMIEGKSVGDGNFQSFGYSIDGGMDMDGNSYPDMVVGSLDDRIALIRARPVIHLTKNFTVEPFIVDPNQCTDAKPCISATVCMSFTLSNGNKDFKKSIVVDYTMEAGVGELRRRVYFQDDRSTFSGSLSLSSSKSICETLNVFVKTPVRDKLDAVHFSINMSLPEQTSKARRSLQNLDSFPVLSQDQKLIHKAEIHFQKECGTDNKCSSNLQLKAQFVDEKETPYPRRDGMQIFQYNRNMRIIIGLKVDVTNLKSPGKVAEDAHQTMLSVTIPNTLKYAGVRPPTYQCNANDANDGVLCEIGNPLKAEEMTSLRLLFETSDIDLNTNLIECQLLLSTVSEQSDLKREAVGILIESTILPSFSAKALSVGTKFGGTVMGESAMVNTSDVGSLVEFTFNVDMNEQLLGDLGTLAVEFKWPFEVANGKWLLYLTKVVVKGRSETECDAGGLVNSLNLSLSHSRPQRTKRQADEDDANEKFQSQTTEPQAASKLLTLPKKESYLLDCTQGTAKCVTFSCPLLNMSKTAEIYVRSRLWNSTMLEDYSNALTVTVKGQATLWLMAKKPTIKMETQTIEFKVVIEPEEGVETPYELPLWIIISAVVAGVLLLAIIIAILWKLGFFKRALYYRIMPKHRAVKIRRAERYQFNLGFRPEEPQKKYWITNWTEMQHFYY
ncbi:integrin alpha-3 isoform X1 [Oryzias latipes]|uniref:Integrin, alpha 3b n=1 Tax=Oryzias latipes TaxID=8090 RepID=A0A3B3HZ34_ORYLA|nr:integrin alpha-3 isoform X1 [Oryzias latipes]